MVVIECSMILIFFFSMVLNHFSMVFIDVSIDVSIVVLY